MQRPLALIALVALGVALAGASGANVRKSPRHHSAAHHRFARARTRHRVVEMWDTGSVPQTPYHTVAMERQDTRLRTSLEHRFGRTGVVGAVGYNRAAASPELDPHEVNSAASTQLGRPSSTVGAKVSIPF